MNAELVAIICHEANKAYCVTIGDMTQKHWEDAPLWQRISAIKGVQALIDNPRLTPEELHAEWCKEKIRDGWNYGKIKDPEKKEHPCLVPYEELPEEQQVKDRLFYAIVGVFDV